jgi:hypothetical protein
MFRSEMDGVVSALQNFHRGLGAGGGVTYELGHKGNHEIEETDGLDESETKNGVGEKLATEGRVAGNTVEESGEDETDTDTSTSQTDGGSTHTQVLGDLNHGVGDLGRVGTALDLEGVAGGGVDDGVHLGALEGLERRGWKERAFVSFLFASSSSSSGSAIADGSLPARSVELPGLHSRDLLVMVRLAIWVRMAGRATLAPIWEASLEARTRVEAIVSDGRGDVCLGGETELTGLGWESKEKLKNEDSEWTARWGRKEEKLEGERAEERTCGVTGDLGLAMAMVSSHWPMPSGEAFSQAHPSPTDTVISRWSQRPGIHIGSDLLWSFQAVLPTGPRAKSELLRRHWLDTTAFLNRISSPGSAATHTSICT